MLFSLLERVGGLFDRRFLFASVLPVLIFSAAIASTLVGVVGVSPAFDWASNQSALQKTVVGALATGALVVFSYVIGALHSVFVSLWSGRISLPFPFFRLYLEAGEARQRDCYESLREEARRSHSETWRRLQGVFRSEVEATTHSPNPKRPATGQEVGQLGALVGRVTDDTTPEIIESLCRQISTQYQTRTVNSLTSVYFALNQVLEDRIRRGDQVAQTTMAELDRSYGGIESICPTRFGNLIEAYESYPHKRYGMEGVVFWPALRSVVPPSYLQVLQDSETFVDFATAMATFAATFAILSTFVGPWLSWTPAYWMLLGLAGVLGAYGFHRLATTAVSQYGEIRRACVDLFRLDLMYALYRPHPANLAQERSQWQELSQLSTYGEVNLPNYEIRTRDVKSCSEDA